MSSFQNDDEEEKQDIWDLLKKRNNLNSSDYDDVGLTGRLRGLVTAL